MIVRPRVGFGGVSGLRHPAVRRLCRVRSRRRLSRRMTSSDWRAAVDHLQVPGTQFVLRTDKLGSIGRGVPVYYRSIPVGQVFGHELAEDKKGLTVKAFVDAPNDQLVRPSSRFWNASGVNVSVGADGVDVAMESLEALLAGGIAFDTPDIDQPRAGRRRDGLSAVREPARGDRGGLHPAHPLPGPLRRLGPRPARRGAGRVQRHPGWHRDRRPARDRRQAGYRAHSGDPRNEPQRFGVERGAGSNAMSSWLPWSNAGCERS